MNVLLFQFTLPRRERPWPYIIISSCCDFNSRSREGSDHGRISFPSRVSISIHAPAKGATVPASATARVLSISIHAPAKGATFGSRKTKSFILISIHAPAKGATFSAVSTAKDFCYFNSRSREGSDSFLCPFSILPLKISIHAPAKGATISANRPESVLQHFNSRSREGSDKRAEPKAPRRFIFQFTLPRRERPSCFPYGRFLPVISIHAPAKGATVCVFGSARTSSDFNSRSREGSDCHPVCAAVTAQHFNSRSREGSDGNYLAVHYWQHRFQFTLPRRERRQLVLMCRVGNTDFNSRSREGSDQQRPIPFAGFPRFQFTLPRRERLFPSSFLRHQVKFQFTLPRRERPRCLAQTT